MNNNFVRAALVAAAVVAAVIIGANLLPKQHVGPSPSVEPTASAVGGPPALNTLPTGDLAAGTYEIDAVFPARLTFTLPTGYGHGRGESDGVGIQYSAAGPQHGIEFQIASNVYPDPCHSAAGLADPPVGPSAQDLVTAMTTMVGFEPGPVTDVTIGGLPAKAFDLTNEIDATMCDGESIRAFIFKGGGPSFIGTSQRERIYVMDVQGTRLMIMTYYFPNGDAAAEAAAAAELKAIVESIAFL